MTKPIYLFSTSSHPETISVNSLEIELLKPSIDFSKYDYLIITSKQISEALKEYGLEDYKEKKALCISKQSAKAFEAIGGIVLSVGKGYGDSLYDTIKSYPKQTRWVYLRAAEIASDFVEICQSEAYKIDEVILYKSRCSKEIATVTCEKNAVLIFTSPSSVKCYLQHSTIYDTQKIVVIGMTTAKALPKNIDYICSKEKNIDDCVSIAKNL